MRSAIKTMAACARPVWAGRRKALKNLGGAATLAGLAGTGLLAVLPAHQALAAEAALPLSASLRDELAAALAAHQPLVVMVSLQGCPFCRVVRQSHLAPMLAQGQIHVVQVDMRSSRATQGWQGEATTHDALVRGWGIKVTPTLLFVGPGGREVAPRLEGALLEDFYGAYLDDRLQAARKAVLAAA